MKDNLDFKIVNKKEYLAKAGVGSKYRNIIESIENIEDDEIILVECNKSEIVSIMSSVNHYFGRGIYSYKTIPSTEKRIIFNKKDK